MEERVRKVSRGKHFPLPKGRNYTLEKPERSPEIEE